MASRHSRLAVATTALTFVLILVGEYTAVSASGATCGLEWPSCSGQFLPFGLPVHDFIEWGHRAFAGVVGLVILATGGLAWRDYDDPGIRKSALAAVVLLPTQVILGGVTVTLGGLVPWGYAPAIQAAHHVTALALYGALVAATVRMRRMDGVSGTRRRTMVAVALAALPVQVALSRGTLFNYVTPIQLSHHAVELVALTAVFTVFVSAYDQHRTGRVGRVAGAATVLLVGQILLGVGIVPYTGTVQVAYYVLAAVVGALLVVLYRATGAGADNPSARGTVRRSE